MITSIVGRLIKKPEVNDRVNIPGKTVMNFTLVQNSKRSNKKIGVFFNLSMVVGTEGQLNLIHSFEKGTVLSFSAPRINYVSQTDKAAEEVTINIYADVNSFEIVAGVGGDGMGGGGYAQQGGGYGSQDNYGAQGGYQQPQGGGYQQPQGGGYQQPPQGGGYQQPATARRGRPAPQPTGYDDIPPHDDLDDPFAE